MGVFGRIAAALGPKRSADFTAAIRPRRANSDDSASPNPYRRAASERRVATRNMDELIGMCRMVLADGVVEDHEARFLLDWIENNYHAAQEWPGSILYPRLTAALADGHLDADEESELLTVLAKVAGGPPSGANPSVSGAIPFNDPPPPVVFKLNCFALTGQFLYGPRKNVEAAIELRGGRVATSVSGRCQYLIVGTFGSEEWLHSTHGRKIIKAVELKASGKAICIMSERHWTEQLV